ncbi:MAG: hypothetical protein QXX84_02665 [Sulfolobales archaeon]
MPFGSTAAHDPAGLEILWARLKSLDMTMNKVIGMNIQGQTVIIIPWLLLISLDISLKTMEDYVG